MTTDPTDQPFLDPLVLLKGLVSLRRLTGMYPPGHPSIEQKLSELDDVVQKHLRDAPALRIDVIHGSAHLDGIAFRNESDMQSQIVRELTDLGVDSIHIVPGVTRQELHAVAEFLWQLKEAPSGEPMQVQLARRQIQHVSLARIVPLDTRWKAAQWPDAPTGPMDPGVCGDAGAYGADVRGCLVGTRRQPRHGARHRPAPDPQGGGQQRRARPDPGRQVVRESHLLPFGQRRDAEPADRAAAGIRRVGDRRRRRGGAAPRHRQDAHPDRSAAQAGRARPPRAQSDGGTHDASARRSSSRSTDCGRSTPTVALEHHRAVQGGGYPDLGEQAVPHLLSQLVAVADIYEAMTGARSYQDPAMPEQACLVLARLAGTKLNTALVKAFVNAISFFPLGSVVRTDRDEMGVVVGTNAGEPLHPVIALITPKYQRLDGFVNTSQRDLEGVVRATRGGDADAGTRLRRHGVSRGLLTHGSRSLVLGAGRNGTCFESL